jgi:hypothetical protein
MANLDLLNEFWKRTEQEQKWHGYASTVRKLRPFTLDAELAGIVSKLADTGEKTLRNYLQTARLPYPSMWIEADFATAFAHIKWGADQFRLSHEMPTRVGWLLTEAPPDSGLFAVTRVAMVPDRDDGSELKAMIYPVSHLFSPTASLNVDNAFRTLDGRIHSEVLEAIREVNSDPTFQLLAWGGDSMAAHRVWRREGRGPQIDEARAGPLYQTNVAVMEPAMIALCVNPITPDDAVSIKERAKNILFAGMADQTGELGFICAALALINEVPCKYVPYKPSGVLRAGGRLRPYMSSSIVTIEVPATRRRIRDIQDHLKAKGREAIRHARHEVRGHWRHVDQLPRETENHHRWERFEDRDGRMRWRMWIPKHERGDAKLGWVKQTYHVTRGRGRIPGVGEGEASVATA